MIKEIELNEQQISELIHLLESELKFENLSLTTKVVYNQILSKLENEI